MRHFKTHLLFVVLILFCQSFIVTAQKSILKNQNFNTPRPIFSGKQQHKMLGTTKTITLSANGFTNNGSETTIKSTNAKDNIGDVNLNFSPAAGTQIVPFSSSDTWQVAVDQPWITVDQSTVGVGSLQFKITVTANTGRTTRTGTVTLTFTSGITLTKTIAITQTAEPGNALNFDGVDDYVLVPDNDNSIANTNAFTLEGWVLWQPSTAKDVQFICSKTNEQMELQTGQGTNGIRFIPTPGVYIDAQNVLPVGVWTHIACTYDAATLNAKIYINGTEVHSQNNGTNPVGMLLQNTNTLFTLGNRNGWSYYFKGSIDEFRVWNRALSQTEIRQKMQAPLDIASQSGLVNYFNFNEGVDGSQNSPFTTLHDLASNMDGGLYNFALSGTSSNWVESYAMVAPTALTPVHTNTSGFTAQWSAPAVGTIDKYLLDVSTAGDFSSFVSGYQNYDCGTSLSATLSGLTPQTVYYYRVRAVKASVSSQGAYSNVIKWQVPENPFAVTNNTLLFAPVGGSDSVYVISPDAWTASSNQTWLTLDKSSGAGDDKLMLLVTPNTGNTNRTAVVTLNNGSSSISITVDQIAQPHNALNFNGTNNIVTIPDNDNSITNALSIETWVLWQPTTSTQSIQFICSKASEQMEIQLETGTNNLRFIPTTGVFIDVPNALQPGVWTHIACIYNILPPYAKIYINGNEMSSSNTGYNLAGTALQKTNSTFILGNRNGSNYQFKGSLDEFSIWNRALSQTEIQQHMRAPLDVASQTGLVSYYNFNTGIAGLDNSNQRTLIDVTGNFNGILSNSFILNGTASNWVESYAMVVPVATNATEIKSSGFTANWNAPATGIAEKYLLDVATDANFTNYVGNYHDFDCGNTLSQTVTSLTANTTYYYRVRAEKASVTNQGAYSNAIEVKTGIPTSDKPLSATTLQPYPNPTTGKLYINESKPGAITALKLYNSTGQQILSVQHPTRSEIDLSPYPDGIYYLEITDPESVHTFKVLKANQTGN